MSSAALDAAAGAQGRGRGSAEGRRLGSVQNSGGPSCHFDSRDKTPAMTRRLAGAHRAGRAGQCGSRAKRGGIHRGAWAPPRDQGPRASPPWDQGSWAPPWDQGSWAPPWDQGAHALTRESPSANQTPPLDGYIDIAGLQLELEFRRAPSWCYICTMIAVGSWPLLWQPRRVATKNMSYRYLTCCLE